MDALIIVDMQEGAIGSSNKYDTLGIIERINLLSKKIRSDKGIVIFIQHDGTTEENLKPYTQGWKIIQLLQQNSPNEKADIIIRKTQNDAFYQTDLHETLRKNHVNHLIITGWATDFCVDTTIKSALSKDYIITVAEDCHTASDRPLMSAPDVIQYFNWLWKNMLPTGAINVKSSQDILKH